MKRILPILLITLISITSCNTANEEIQLVRKSFNNYKSAILNDKGEEAVKYVDSRTLSYYSEILEKIKRADSLTVNSAGIMDKIMIFSIRHRTSKEEILSFDGKGLLIYAFKEGMVGKNSVANNTIGDIEIDGDFAKGQLVANGQKAPFYFHFYKENELWKVDLTSIFPAGTMAFKKIIEDSGQEENEYLFVLLEMMTGKKPNNEIWYPIE